MKYPANGAHVERVIPGISVVIKALNEEKFIEEAIRSAIVGVQSVGGEVILADSCSTDKTVELASRYPITVVQLANPRERCCGITPQLGYQKIRCGFIFLMDGDMELVPGFLKEGLKAFLLDPFLGGVAGTMEDLGRLNAEFRLRQIIIPANQRKPGQVSHLAGGGLYRVSAVRSVGYFSNRNLHSFEELELGIRLSDAGWKMVRLPCSSIRHHAHQMRSYSMLLTRWKSKRIFGPGEFLRAAIGKPYFQRVVPQFKFIYVTAIWWLVLLVTLFLPLDYWQKMLAFIIILVVPFPLESFRRKGIGLGAYSIASWTLGLIGAFRGFIRPQIDPKEVVGHRLLKQGDLFKI